MGRNIRVVDINGFKVAFSAVEVEDYVDNAAFLTRKLLEERDYDAFFSVLRMDNKTYIIGRSLEDEIDVGHIMTFFNGGGHPGAGSGNPMRQILPRWWICSKKLLRKISDPWNGQKI